MAKRENCEHRHTNGNCLFNGGFCLANDEEHCVRMNEIKSYNKALEDVIMVAEHNTNQCNVNLYDGTIKNVRFIEIDVLKRIISNIKK